MGEEGVKKGGMAIHGNEYHDPDFEQEGVAAGLIETHRTNATHVEDQPPAEHGNEKHNPDFEQEGVAAGLVVTHEAKTTGIHGVGGSTVESASGSQGKVDTHEAKTTGIHGVGSSTVESASGAQSKVNTHAALTTDVHSFDKGARVYHSGHQSIPSSASATIVAFDTESYDTDTIHDNVTNNSRLTCKTAGKYLIFAQAYWAGNATGYRQAVIFVNGVTNIGMALCDAYGTTGLIQSALTTYSLAVNDYVQMGVAQTSGGALNLLGGPPNNTHFWMQRIS